MARTVSRPLDRVAERRRAAALARHYRDSQELSIGEIARRLGRAPAAVKAYLYDPTGEKARAVKARYRGTCRSCGAATSPRNGKGTLITEESAHPVDEGFHDHRDSRATASAHCDNELDEMRGPLDLVTRESLE